MLDDHLKEQLIGIFANLNSNYKLILEVDPQHLSYSELVEMIHDFCECSPKLSYVIEESSSFVFSIFKDDVFTGISFRAVPGGHEFTSLILAILNADFQGKNLPDDFTSTRIKALIGPIKLTTYVSLSCTNCPEVVQTLNIMATLNPEIEHETVDGALFEDEVKGLGVQAVPTVYANGKSLHIGRGGFVELLDKLESTFESKQNTTEQVTKTYDLIVAGGGPAGTAAAIYSARKGLKVALIAKQIGGQVNETSAIENIPSVLSTTGTQLAQDLKTHASHYAIDLLENRTIESVVLQTQPKTVLIKGGESLEAPQVIIATGASWRRLNIPGEGEYIGRGVAFCPHCDGPLFAGKHVAVIGGGNSGIEAAIDLAGICTEIIVLEFMDTLKADTVLQEKLMSLPNVKVYLSTATTEILGDGTKVTGLIKKDRATGEETKIELDGIFVQIGLAANTELFEGQLEINKAKEIILKDKNCRTPLTGVYAAGDVTDVSYKQIIISMGEGAKAALAAFDDRIRGVM